MADDKMRAIALVAVLVAAGGGYFLFQQYREHAAVQDQTRAARDERVRLVSDYSRACSEMTATAKRRNWFAKTSTKSATKRWQISARRNLLERILSNRRRVLPIRQLLQRLFKQWRAIPVLPATILISAVAVDLDRSARCSSGC